MDSADDDDVGGTSPSSSSSELSRLMLIVGCEMLSVASLSSGDSSKQLTGPSEAPATEEVRGGGAGTTAEATVVSCGTNRTMLSANVDGVSGTSAVSK